MSEPEYIDKRNVDASYRPKGYGISPGLQRARAPYRLRNALTGLTIFSFAVGVWAYSINAVKQDKFEDIDEEARLLSTRKLNTEESVQPLGIVPQAAQTSSAISEAHKAPFTPRFDPHDSHLQYRGVWVAYLERYLDPHQKTLVWGAPPLDRPGASKDG